MNRRVVIIGGLLVLLCVIIASAAALLFFVVRRDTVEAVQEVVAPPQVEVSEATPLSPEDLATQMARVEAQVAVLRGLEPRQEVAKDFMSQADLRGEIEQDFAEDYSPEEARDDALVLSAFDFISPDLDLYNLYVDLYTEQIGGFYDSEEDEFFLISSQSAFGGYERLIFAHEYTHALQDQHFDLESYDLETLYDENPDAALALTSLIEGDAQFLTEQYVLEHFTPEDMQSLFTQVDTFATDVLDSAPEIIQRDLGFPYLEGSHFVQVLYGEGGWRFVDAAYGDPPTSTEHILHPERYLDEDLPQPVELPSALDALGRGWRLVEESTFGEFYLLVYLEQQLEPSVTVPAAEGWGGDRYAVYHHDGSGQAIMVLKLAWDSPGEVGEFMEAYRAYGASRAGRDATTNRDDLTCWTARDYLCVAEKDRRTWVVLGPNRLTVNDVLGVYGISG